MTAGSGSRLRALRPLSSACLLLLFLMLPALIAGVQIDSPASPGEMRRVEEALNPEMQDGYSSSPVARMYYGMTIPGDSNGDPAQTLVMARRVQLLGILGLTCLLYLSVSMVRSRRIAVSARIPNTWARRASTSVCTTSPPASAGIISP